MAYYSVQSKIQINFAVDKVWNLISKPGSLNEVHPFCKENKPLLWEDNANKKDVLVYLNGLEYHREFLKWEEQKGYELMIGKKEGKKSRVIWELKAIGEKSFLKITVFPYRSKKIPRPLYFLAHLFFVRPKLKSYLSSVLNGINWSLTHGKAVPRNHFGVHSWFA